MSHYSVNVTGLSTVSTTFGPNHQYLQSTLSGKPGVDSKAPTTATSTSTTSTDTSTTSTTTATHASPSKPSPVNSNRQVSFCVTFSSGR